MGWIETLNNPTSDVNDAMKQSGIDWNAKTTNVKFTVNGQTHIMPDKYVIFKDKDNTPLGVVGNNYKIYQNSEMWDFIGDFIRTSCSNCKIETATEIKNGRQVIVMLRSKGKEIIKNDTIYEYFGFRNSFDGSTPLQVFFTNKRLVCTNMLTATLKNATTQNALHVIRHTKNLKDKIREMQSIILKSQELQHEINEKLTYLTSKKLDTTKTVHVVKSLIFPKKENMGKRTKTLRKRNVAKVLELVDSGMGTDIPGVRGTGYGLFNAFTEWVDHYKPVKAGKRDKDEVRFESNILETNSRLKNKVLNDLVTNL